MRRSTLFSVLATGSLALATLPAQQPVIPPPEAGHPYTLHVYEDLVQVPTLVLNSVHGSYRGLNEGHFTLRIDSGPGFHPKHLHLEGRDPISLALLLDASTTSQTNLLNSLDRNLKNSPLDLLSDRDRVVVFAFDCMFLATPAAPATMDAVHTAVAAALSYGKLHPAGQPGAHCGGSSRRLWDAIGMAADQVGHLPGRHVLFVISSGLDSGSKSSWESVRAYANGFSVAIFGFRPAFPSKAQIVLNGETKTILERELEDPFGMLCGGTGGIVWDVNSDTLGPSLQRAVELIRGRYILEFQRPANETAGQHLIEVTIPDTSAIIRAAGVSVPLPDKALGADPSTVPSDKSKAPLIGDRRVLSPPR